MSNGLTLVIEFERINDSSVFSFILVQRLHFQNRTSGLGRFWHLDRIRPGLELWPVFVDAGSGSRLLGDRRLGVFIGTLTRYSAEVVRLDGGADSRHPNRDERARLLRHISGVTGDDDDFVNDALPFKVELFGERQEAGLCVDVEVTFTIRLTTVDRIRDATVFALK